MFADRRVRWALAHAFDFQWSNRNLFYGAYSRTTSYYSNSELASRGLPGKDELAVLAPYRGRIPGEVFTKQYVPPIAGTNRRLRANLLKALKILKVVMTITLILCVLFMMSVTPTITTGTLL